MSFYVNTNKGRIYDNNIQRLRNKIWDSIIFDTMISGDFGRVVSIHKEDGKVAQQLFFVILHNAIYLAYTNCNKAHQTYRSYWPIFRFDCPTVFEDAEERQDMKPSNFEDMIEILSLKDRQILCWNRG